MALTEKQRRFVDYYIETGNASEAARRAGYKLENADATGRENLRKPTVKAAIAERLFADICTLRATDYSANRVSGGIATDMADKIARVEDLRARINAEWDRLIDLRHEAYGYISQVASAKQRQLLIKRYLLGEAWEVIAAEWTTESPDKRGCSWQNLHKIHKQALAAMQKILDRVA